MDVEHVAATGSRLGEGPLWHPGRQRLYWVDGFGRMYLTYDPAGGRIERFPMGAFVISLAFRAAGGLLVTTGSRCLVLEDGAAAPRPLAGGPFDARRVRFNDGRVGPGGRYFIGSMHRRELLPLGGLYRLSPDGSFGQVEKDIITSNGLGWSPDRRVFYYTDSIRRTIYAYAYDAASGTIAGRRAFVSSEGEPGVPDGLAVDAEGCVWSARWDGWKLARYDPRGKKMLEVPMPVARPTSCAFGGPGLDTLYVTSAAHGLSPAHRRAHPQSGDLFRLHPGVRGQREHLFGE